MKKQGIAKHFLILSFFNLLIITSCEVFNSTQSSSGTTNPTTTPASCTDGSSNYPWLKVGHELHYAYKGSAGSDSMIVKIVSSTSPGTYRAETKYPGTTKSYAQFYHACGQHLYTSTNGNYNQYKYWWFSIGANVGDLWSREVPGFLYTYQLVAKNVTVQTTLLHRTITNCYKFTGHDPFNNLNDTIWFKPDAGIVYYSGSKEKYEMAYKNFGAAKP